MSNVKKSFSSMQTSRVVSAGENSLYPPSNHEIHRNSSGSPDVQLSSSVATANFLGLTVRPTTQGGSFNNDTLGPDQSNLNFMRNSGGPNAGQTPTVVFGSVHSANSGENLSSM